MNRRSLLYLFVGIIGLVGCRNDTRTPVVVYSPHGKELLGEFERRYEAVHPDQDVQWLDMGSQDVYDRVRTERDNPQADVWWGAPSTIFIRAEQESLLQRYTPSWNSAVEPERKSRSGYWYGTFITPEVIMFNSRLIAQADAPRDWDDLLDPKWKGRILIRYPLASGTVRIIFSALIQRENRKNGDSLAGFDWLRRLDANTRSYVSDPTQLYLKLAREEAALTVWDLPDAQLQIETNNQPFGYILPASGTPIVTDGIAIIKGARHPIAAREFLEFVTSKESVIEQAAKFFRIPARSDIPHEKLPAWMTTFAYTPMDVDWDDLMFHERNWMRTWDETVKGRGAAQTGAD